MLLSFWLTLSEVSSVTEHNDKEHKYSTASLFKKFVDWKSESGTSNKINRNDFSELLNKIVEVKKIRIQDTTLRGIIFTVNSIKDDIGSYTSIKDLFQ
jgi:hypothetical protein